MELLIILFGLICMSIWIYIFFKGFVYITENFGEFDAFIYVFVYIFITFYVPIKLYYVLGGI